MNYITLCIVFCGGSHIYTQEYRFNIQIWHSFLCGAGTSLTSNIVVNIESKVEIEIIDLDFPTALLHQSSNGTDIFNMIKSAQALPYDNKTNFVYINNACIYRH